MKKRSLIILSICLCLCFGLVGCGKDDKIDITTTSTTITTESEITDLSTMSYDEVYAQAATFRTLIYQVLGTEKYYEYLTESNSDICIDNNQLFVYINENIASDDIANSICSQIQSDTDFKNITLPIYATISSDGSIYQMAIRNKEQFIIIIDNSENVSEDIYNRQLNGENYDDIINEANDDNLIGTYSLYEVNGQKVTDLIEQAKQTNVDYSSLNMYIILNNDNSIIMYYDNQTMNGIYTKNNNIITITIDNDSLDFNYDNSNQTLTTNADGTNMVYKKTDDINIDINETSNTIYDTLDFETKQAYDKGLRYLDSSDFSKQGLIEQLEYEQFPTDCCIQAVEAIEQDGNVDWQVEAINKANSYLSHSSFSKQELIEQLEYEKFTEEEANYAVEQVYK